MFFWLTKQKIKHLRYSLFIFVFVIFCAASAVGQELYYRSGEKTRTILPGLGQEYNEPLIPVDKFFFVQFGVYEEGNLNPHEIKAPSGIGQVWLIFHQGTVVHGKENRGAYYIVKPFSSIEEAQRAISSYRESGMECWYNPALTGASFQLISATSDQDTLIPSTN